MDFWPESPASGVEKWISGFFRATRSGKNAPHKQKKVGCAIFSIYDLKQGHLYNQRFAQISVIR
jgi:hypothetical protein